MKRSIHTIPTRLALSIIPPSLQPQWQTAQSSICAARHASTDSLPRVIQPSLWQNIVPKAFRPAPRASTSTPRLSRWRRLRHVWNNPATVFIAFGLMIGSNAINLLLLRNSMADYSRKADAKIALLREVFESVQRGEEVDVEGLLGTGNEESDKDWKEGESTCVPRPSLLVFLLEPATNQSLVLHAHSLGFQLTGTAVLEEIEGEERSWQSRKRRKANLAEASASQDSASSRTQAAPAAVSSASSLPDSKDESSAVNYLVPLQERGTVQFL